jgi:pyruvate dehydrogenase E2 component (dihydrolipoamide acetyltransferase)
LLKPDRSPTEQNVSRTIEIKVPDIGDFSDVPVIEVLVAAGDRVEPEDGLVTLESDKATMEVPSPEGGVIKEMRLKVDDTVSEGDIVAVLEVAEGAESGEEQGPEAEQPATSGGDEAAEEGAAEDSAPELEGAEEGEQPEGRTSEGAAPASPAGEPGATPEDLESGFTEEEAAEPEAAERLEGARAVDPASVPYASPAVRKFARELGVDLKRVKGTGDRERILRDDVAAFVKQTLSGERSERTGSGGGLAFDFPPRPQVDFSRYGEVERQKLSRIQKISAGHLHRNWVGIPHVTQHDEADITDMESFRQANADEAKAQGFKLTPLVFLMKAMVSALRKYPRFNASLDADGETLVLKKYFNIGVAVDTPDGLVVPVIRECERKGIMELAEELGKVSAKAREGKLSPSDIQGGCISISSLGGIGGTAFTPIINAPEVAILGVSRSRMQPVWNGEEFRPRLMLPLSLSYDHRVIDGAAAARFTRYLASRLEDLRRLTL